jgi:superfamily II DNA or RNA helicase
MRLRPYQESARDSAWTIAQQRPAAVVLATGLGKSHVIEGVARRGWEERGRKPALLLAHTKPLLDQLSAKLASQGWTVCREQAKDRALLSWARTAGLSGPTVVVASVATMRTLSRHYERWHSEDDEHRGRRYTSFPRDFFSSALIDETHHAVAESYRLMIDWFTCPWIGVTATAQRKGLGDIFALAEGSMTLRDGVLDGWLVPPRFIRQEVHEWDLSELRRGKGDVDAAQLAQIVEAAMPAVLEPLREVLGDRRCVAFWPSVCAATRGAEWLRAAEISARAVWADTEQGERREIFDGLAEGGVQVVSNCGVLTEGFDEPTIRCVAIARPTRSELLYIQMAGRGVRPWPGTVDGLDQATADERKAAIAASPKPDCLILDYEGHGAKFDLAGPACLLSGLDEAEAKEAAELLGAGVLFEEAEAEAKRRVIEQERLARELAARAERAAELRKKSPWSMSEEDYLQLGMPARFARKSTADMAARCSRAQRGLIYRLNCDVARMEGAADEQATARKVWPVSETWTKRAASDEITYLQHRLKRRPAMTQEGGTP